MKSIVILYKDSNSKYGNENSFNGKNSYDLSKEWALSICETVVEISDCKSVSELFSSINKACEKHAADFVIYSYADLPFLSTAVTKNLIENHIEYKAEYTFADGYPYGFTPEVIDCGTLRILENLSNTVQKQDGEKQVTRESIMDFMKKDINSYEIEAILADNDWRLLRYKFDCSCKENFMACKELYKDFSSDINIEELCKKASENPKILKTIPGFYEIQIADKCGGKCSYCPYPKAYSEKFGSEVCDSKNLMSLENFKILIEKIKAFSESAVISLSLWGEAFNHPQLMDFISAVIENPELSVFIETDGFGITEVFCESLKTCMEKWPEHKNKWPQVMIAVSLDSVSNEMYKKLRGEEKAVKELAEKIKLLNQVIPGNVYPQFIRMNENEAELESFYRYWNEKSSESGGNLLIQKYNDFADLLPENKPADLSPLERNVCWHLRRNMTILSNGDVPLCKQYVLNGIIGNIFNEELETIWAKTEKLVMDHVNGNYSDKCKDCDEFYTFQF